MQVLIFFICKNAPKNNNQCAIFNDNSGCGEIIFLNSNIQTFSPSSLIGVYPPGCRVLFHLYVKAQKSEYDD